MPSDAERVERWNAENPERRKEIAREWARNNPLPKDVKLDRNLRAKYGISLVEYQKMVLDHGGVCAICHEPNYDGRRLVVDHCHDTGKVRGLLCNACNGGIGLLKDSVLRLESAINYLKERN